MSIEKLASDTIVQECDATPFELLELLMTKFGREWIEWEPETLWTITRIDDTTDMCMYNKNKIMAMKTILSNDLFWKQWHIFEKCVLALNNVPPRFDVMEEVTPAQMAYAVRVAYELRAYPGANTPGKDPVFAPEVKAYVAARAHLEGLVYLPEPLDFAQAKLDEMSGEAKLVDRIKARLNDPDGAADETPEGIGAVRAAVIKAYAYSKKRKPLV